MNSKLTKKITITAMATAITMLFTIAIRIPTPTGGHINLGDTAVILSAFLLGPVAGGLAGGIGSALADLLGGHYFFVPATFIIKTAEGILAGILLEKIPSDNNDIIASLSSIILMIGGYYIYEAIFIHHIAALSVIIPNTIQGIICALCAVLIFRKIGVRFRNYRHSV